MKWKFTKEEIDWVRESITYLVMKIEDPNYIPSLPYEIKQRRIEHHKEIAGSIMKKMNQHKSKTP